MKNYLNIFKNILNQEEYFMDGKNKYEGKEYGNMELVTWISSFLGWSALGIHKMRLPPENVTSTHVTAHGHNID